MLAAVLRKFGGPLSLEEVSSPLNPVKVGATGLCHGDLHIIMGEWTWDLSLKLPLVLGHEISVVNEDKTYLVYNARGCGLCKQCRRGENQFCEKLNVLGVNMNGGFAEYVDVTGFPLVPVKGNPIDATPLADAGVTAMNSVDGIEQGSKVAVLGTGEVAMISIQLLRNEGAEVWVVGRNQAKLRKAKELGADEIVYTGGEYSTDLSAFATSNKFDVIIDYVGSQYTLRDLPWLLRRTGELRVVGEFGGELTLPEQLLVLRGLKVRGILYGSLEQMKRVVRLYETGKLKTLALPYSIKEINSAIIDLIQGRVIGRPVIYPGS
ncbi:alcohol dehydrogenase catalytic domain-containing protein [Metallosphaera cuprina]|nr:zinc-binding dehydrogenase [Metallosphaera cuprina]